MTRTVVWGGQTGCDVVMTTQSMYH